MQPALKDDLDDEEDILNDLKADATALQSQIDALKAANPNDFRIDSLQDELDDLNDDDIDNQDDDVNDAEDIVNDAEDDLNDAEDYEDDVKSACRDL